MLAKSRAQLRSMGRCVVVAACLAMLPGGVLAQAWEATSLVRYDIEDVAVSPAGGGMWTVNVVLSVTNTVTGERCDITFARPFRLPGADSAPTGGWAAGADATDTGSDTVLVSLVSSTALGGGAALPVHPRNLQASYASLRGSAEGASCRGGQVIDN